MPCVGKVEREAATLININKRPSGAFLPPPTQRRKQGNCPAGVSVRRPAAASTRLPGLHTLRTPTQTTYTHVSMGQILQLYY